MEGVLPLLDVVAETVARHAMLRPGDRVVVGVSGGPDSLALLDVLARLRDAFGVSLVAAHLNHGLRADAAADLNAVRRVAGGLGVPVRADRAELGPWRGGGSLQAAARRARYRFFREVAAAEGAGVLALGHQLDDQAETVLLRLLRGAGPDGLAGIAPVRRERKSGLRVVRPLIDVPRADVEAYCAARDLRPVADPSNLRPVFLRNRIRLELLPLLERDYAVNLRPRLARLAAALRADREVLEDQAARALEGLVRRRAPGLVALDAAALAGLEPAVARRAVRQALEALFAGDGAGDDPEAPPEPAVESALELARAAGQGDVPARALAGGMTGRVAGGALWLERARQAPGGYCRRLEVPGAVEVPEAGVTISARLSSVFDLGGLDGIRAGDLAAVDYNKVTLPLWVRNRRPGDRFRPLGLGGHKKLKDFFIAEGVPRPWRDRLPLVAAGPSGEDRIVWVAGHRIDDSARCDADTRTAIVLDCVAAGGE